jgi:hypothetical protein
VPALLPGPGCDQVDDEEGNQAHNSDDGTGGHAKRVENEARDQNQ